MDLAQVHPNASVETGHLGSYLKVIVYCKQGIIWLIKLLINSISFKVAESCSGWKQMAHSFIGLYLFLTMGWYTQTNRVISIIIIGFIEI